MEVRIPRRLIVRTKAKNNGVIVLFSVEIIAEAGFDGILCLLSLDFKIFCATFGLFAIMYTFVSAEFAIGCIQ